jgi:predicted secreted protein with PEFG-CTERM motif
VVNGQSHNASLISYYDKISEFNFNPRNNTFSWAVPFDWNVSKTSFASNFIVHEEVWLPKNWSGIGDTSYFSGSVNGFKLPNRELLIDPFSYPNQLVVHFLLGKIDVLRLAQELGPTEDVQMHFELLPIATSSEWSGDRTSILANWNSAQLAAGRNVTVNLKFIDSESAEGQKKINGTVLYDLNFTDMLGNDLVSKTNLVAINGEDNETLIFPYNSSYSIEARIISIGAATGSPAEDKLDIATGFVVVPEFKFAALVVLAVPTALAVILARKWLGNSDTR